MIVRRVIAAAALSPALLAAPACAQTLGQGADTDIPWVRLIAALLLCIGLAAGAAFALNRRLNGGAGLPDKAVLADLMARLRPAPVVGERRARLTDIETRRVSTQVSVSVFKCDGRDFLVAASVQGQLVLVSLDEDKVEART